MTCLLYARDKFSKSKDYSKSLPDFNKVIELDKKYDKAYLMRGVVFDRMGDFKKAIADWKEAKKINRDNSN